MFWSKVAKYLIQHMCYIHIYEPCMMHIHNHFTKRMINIYVEKIIYETTNILLPPKLNFANTSVTR